jgi:YVTN family beta-propeller protein
VIASLLLMAVTTACSSQPSVGGPMPARTGPRVFVSNEISGTVSVIDVASRKVVHTIPVGKRPRGIRASSDGSTIFVALSGSPIAGPGVDEDTLPPPERRYDGIGVIDLASGTLKETLPSGTDPEQFAVSRDDKKLFIANEDAGQVSVLDLSARTIVKGIKVGGEPEGVDLSPDGRFVYVTAEGDNQVTAIDTERLETAAVIKVGPRPRSTGFLPNAPLAYVSAENDGAVYLVDTATHQTRQRIPLASDTLRPMGIVAAPDGRRVFVSTGRGKTVEAIDPSTNTVAASLEVGERPWGLAVSPDGTLLFTANGPSNDVTIVDIAKWSIVAKVPVGDRPWGVVYVP